MSSDALERLKNRVKPTVEAREPALSPTKIEDDSSTPNNQVLGESQDISKPKFISELTPTSEMNLEIKQTTIRLEKSLAARLSSECQNQDISREVFIEALFLYYENNAGVQKKILKDAKKRHQQRTAIANYRRAKSMMSKFGNLP